MRFLAPIALAGLSLLLLPVAIHLLVRRRAMLVDFPSLKFLRATRSHQWSPRQLQQPLLLALRLLGLVLLLLGLAQPFRSRAESRDKFTVLLLDASFSMRAGQRAQAAREQALAFIDRMPATERAAVIAFDGQSTVLAEPTTDRKILRDAVNRYQPGRGWADYVDAVRHATELLKRNAAGDAQVVLISDFQASGLPDEPGLRAEIVQLGVRITTVPVGAAVAGNTYWTSLRIRRGDGSVEVSATETSSGAEGIAVVERIWKLMGPVGQQPGIAWQTEANGQVTGHLQTQTPDSIPDDDRVAFAFDPDGRRGVILVNDGTDSTTYLRAALSANAGDGESSEVVVAQQVPGPGELNRYRLLVLTLHGTPNAEALSRAVEFARSGGTVWLLAGDDLNSESWSQFVAGDGGRELPFTGLVRLDPAVQPRLQVVDALATPVHELSGRDRDALNIVPFRTGYTLSARPPASVVVRWSNAQPALVQISVGRGSIIVLATSPERSAGGLGLSPVFPQLAGSIMASGGINAEPRVYSIGALPADLLRASAVEVTGPNGTVESVTYTGASKKPDDVFSQPGLYRIGASAEGRFVALRPPASESETALADPGLVRGLFAPEPTSAQSATTQPQSPHNAESAWWRILVGLGSILLCIEAIVAVAKQRNATDVAMASGVSSS